MKRTILNMALSVVCTWFLSLTIIAQNEDPAKLLAFKKKEQFDKYLNGLNWKPEKKIVPDSTDGEYFLYSKKTSGGGNAYMAVYPNKFVHYQVFYEAKNDYSKVLTYEEFLNMPEGKSRFNASNENKVYAIKSITFDDPKETRNQNLYFGKTKIKEGMNLTTAGTLEEMESEKQLKQKIKQQELEEKQLDEKLNEEEENASPKKKPK